MKRGSTDFGASLWEIKNKFKGDIKDGDVEKIREREEFTQALLHAYCLAELFIFHFVYPEIGEQNWIERLVEFRAKAAQWGVGEIKREEWDKWTKAHFPSVGIPIMHFTLLEDGMKLINFWYVLINF
jgi:hypothetical protein